MTAKKIVLGIVFATWCLPSVGMDNNNQHDDETRCCLTDCLAKPLQTGWYCLQKGGALTTQAATKWYKFHDAAARKLKEKKDN